MRATQQKLPELNAPEDSGSRTSSSETNLATCQQGDISQSAENMTQELVFDKLPEDLLHHVHSLLPLQDAARATCVSHGFLRSWRCYSNLTLNWHTLGLIDKNLSSDEEVETHLIDKVNHILNNHSGIGLKTLELDLFPCTSISASYLDRWLQTAVKSGIEEFTLSIFNMKKEYDFPCSVLSDETAARSIQSFNLSACAFHPTATLGCLRRLKSLLLFNVNITEEELGHLFSKSFALERLHIFYCTKIICLKIPCTLQQLKFLEVKRCEMMQVVEINAPNLSSFHYEGTLIEIIVRDSSKLKVVNMAFTCLSYAYTKLPSIAQNVGSLTLVSRDRNLNTPILPAKLRHLRNLEIRLHRSPVASPPSYDFFSLISLLDASPSLDSFTLRVDQYGIGHDSVVMDDAYLRQKPDWRHDHIRQVMIMGFCSDKSMVELASHILESTPSLQRLTLDTTTGCSASESRGSCWPMDMADLAKAERAVETASRYIAGKVPSAVEFTILKPCSRCHSAKR